MSKASHSTSASTKSNRGWLGPESEELTPFQREARDDLRKEIDGNPFMWKIWAVAASGFFTDSYNLFSTNVIFPSLAYVYWQQDTNTYRETLINCVTLAGSIVGQLSFGILADLKGRTSLYGVELIIVIFSTIGLASSSSGVGNNMSMLAWLTVWRFVMGVGIGAEYPLSAVIASEWSSTEARARMMSAVFFMQPVGQLVAQLVGLWVLLGRRDHLARHCGRSQSDDLCRAEVDRIWRIVTGVGAAPALLAIITRFLIWDAGIYVLEVEKDIGKALRNSHHIYRKMKVDYDKGTGHLLSTVNVHDERGNTERRQFSYKDLRYYLISQGNWRYLAGTSFCWFLLDFSFYGLGLGNPRTISKMFAVSRQEKISQVPSWNILLNPNATIYESLLANAEQSIYTVSIAATFGSALFILAAKYIRRKSWLVGSFVAQSMAFILAGATFYAVFHTPSHFTTVALVALCSFLFNFGANTLTFLIPAEIFPSCYRATGHGIAAASGKLGSIVVALILRKIDVSNPNNKALGYVFIIFGIVMLLGAFFAWLWIPEVQEVERMPSVHSFVPLKPTISKTLEDLGEGIKKRDDFELSTKLKRRGDIGRRQVRSHDVSYEMR